MRNNYSIRRLRVRLRWKSNRPGCLHCEVLTSPQVNQTFLLKVIVENINRSPVSDIINHLKNHSGQRPQKGLSVDYSLNTIEYSWYWSENGTKA